MVAALLQSAATMATRATAAAGGGGEATGEADEGGDAIAEEEDEDEDDEDDGEGNGGAVAAAGDSALSAARLRYVLTRAPNESLGGLTPLQLAAVCDDVDVFLAVARFAAELSVPCGAPPRCSPCSEVSVKNVWGRTCNGEKAAQYPGPASGRKPRSLQTQRSRAESEAGESCAASGAQMPPCLLSACSANEVL